MPERGLLETWIEKQSSINPAGAAMGKTLLELYGDFPPDASPESIPSLEWPELRRLGEKPLDFGEREENSLDLPEVTKLPPLTAKEEMVIVGQMIEAKKRNDKKLYDESLSHIFRANIETVGRIADYVYSTSHAAEILLTPGDLFQEGMIGMMTAIERFDPQEGVRLMSYVGRRARGAMLDFIRSEYASYKSRSRRMWEDYEEIYSQRAEIEQITGREATIEEIALAAEKSIKDTRRILEIVEMETISLDDNNIDDNNIDVVELRDSIEDPYENMEETVVRKFNLEYELPILKEAIETLPKRLQYVLISRFGLASEEEYTQIQIAETLGIKRARICQLEAQALDKLKTFLQDPALLVA